MKQCPHCGRTYGGEVGFCPKDGSPLAPAAGQNETQWDTPTRKPVNVLAIVAGFLVTLMLGAGGVYLLIRYRADVDRKSGENVSQTVNTNSSTAPNIVKTATPTPSPDRAQMQQIVNSKIKSILSKEDLEEEDKNLRKILYGDLDGDGDEDAVVQYGWSFIGGNGWGLSLMVLTSENGEYSFAADAVVGGKMERSTELKSIKNGRIVLETMSYTEDDAACCPSIKGSTAYSLKRGKLIESKK